MFLPPVPDRRWQLASQAGVKFAICRVNPAFDPFDLDSMAQAQKGFRDAGFEIAALGRIFAIGYFKGIFDMIGKKHSVN